jgi:hypothetical protein
MRVQAMIQSTVVTEISAEADAGSARELVEAQVPDGSELIQVHNAMPRGGRVIATGLIRVQEVQTLTSEGNDYPAAKAALQQQLPDGWRILSCVSLEATS